MFNVSQAEASCPLYECMYIQCMYVQHPMCTYIVFVHTVVRVLLTSDLCNKLKALLIMFIFFPFFRDTSAHILTHTHTYALTGITLKQELFPMDTGSGLWRGKGGQIRTGEEIGEGGVVGGGTKGQIWSNWILIKDVRF